MNVMCDDQSQPSIALAPARYHVVSPSRTMQPSLIVFGRGASRFHDQMT